MKALSLRQPWATLMAEQYKCIETRSWSTPYRGALAIHAAKKKDLEARHLWISEKRSGAIPRSLPLFDDLPLGRLLCVVELIDVVPTEWLLESHEDKASQYRTEYFSHNGMPEPEERYGDYSPGRFAWITQGCRKVDGQPPAVGHQWLFNVELPDGHVLAETDGGK